ncbi:MAG: hypothetical protein ACAH80_04440 [Alphaproteobacteria bacterium]
MKKLAFFGIVGFALLLGLSTSQAQVLGQYGGFATPMGAPAAPSITTPEQVMLLHHVLSARRPDFKGIARASDEYKAANDFDKEKVVDAKVMALRNNYEMTTAGDKLVVKVPVTVSSFSVRNKGFIINELNDAMNFKYVYSGKNYAFIPLQLGEHQWIDASDDATALAIDKGRGKNNDYMLYIFFSPTYADPPDRMTPLEDGKEYTVMTGSIDHIDLFDAESKEKLWSNMQKAAPDPMNDSLLQLKK